MNRRGRLGLIAILTLLGLLTLLIVDPHGRLLGLLHGEAFYRWRPTTYWRGVLAQDGAARKLRRSTFDQFFKSRRAVPVLKELLLDPDANVRWPCVRLIGLCASVRDQERIFTRLLDDPEEDIRFEVLGALESLGPQAPGALPKLQELARTKNDAERIAALYVLWSIDPKTAQKTEKWATYTSEPWGFSASMPSRVETTPHTSSLDGSKVHQFTTLCGLATFTIAVSSVHPNNKLTTEERYEMAPGAVAAAVKGKVQHNKPIQQHGHAGREQCIATEEATLRSRVFIVGDRVYQAQAVYKPDAVHPDAIDYFLDSFAIK